MSLNINTHFEELKWRIFYTWFSFIVSCVIIYIKIESLIFVFIKPIWIEDTQISLIYTHTGEAFIAYLKLSIISGALLVIPYLSIQVYLFILPGLFEYEAKKIRLTLWVSLIISGLSIGLFVYILAPTIYSFLISFQNSEFIPLVYQPKINEIVSFHTYLLAISILIVWLPSLLLWTPYVKKLGNYRHWIWVTSLLLAAILTPPDVFSQMLISILLSVFIEFIILLHYIRLSFK